jgi:tetratricopeptide (TPR) repeat protein
MPTIEQLVEALTLLPEDPVLHFSLGNAYRDDGQTAEAIQHYREAARHKSDYSAAWFEMARLAEKDGQLDVAIEAYVGAMKASRGSGDDHIMNAAEVRLKRLRRRET